MSSKNNKRRYNVFFPIIFLLKVFIVFTLLLVIMLLIFKWINPPVSAFIASNSIAEHIIEFTNTSYKQNWVKYDDISPHFFTAVIASEDQSFIDHFGFDFKQIEKAMEEQESGKRLRGASTITQQTAKNLFLWSGKDFIRKGLEAYITLWIEIIWSKKRILEVYVNIAELGDNIYGIEAASMFHFNKPAKRLSRSEAVIIAAILPYPKRYNLRKPTNFLINKREKILIKMDQIGGNAILKKL